MQMKNVASGQIAFGQHVRLFKEGHECFPGFVRWHTA
jgi:hypothetical protein